MGDKYDSDKLIPNKSQRNSLDKFEKGKADKFSFWLFNIANIVCTMAIVGYAMICCIETEPVAAFNISVYAVFQAIFSLMLNILFHKAAKDKEVYLDD